MFKHLNLFKLAVTLSFIATASGCETMYGVSRTASDVSYPPIDCIERTLLAQSELSNVSYRKEIGGQPLSLRGIEERDQIHRFSYEYLGLHSNFYFLISFDKRVMFRHTHLYMNKKPSQIEINAIRPMMLKIEKSIIENCKFDELSSAIRESCLGVTCT